MPIDYIKHHHLQNLEHNTELDNLWKEYADSRNKEEILELQRQEESRKSGLAYDTYRIRYGEIIQLSYGEPFLRIKDKLMVYDDCWVIRKAISYNNEFPKSPLLVPRPGQECYLSYCSLWPGTETVVIQSVYGWSTPHVPYIDAQNMRIEWLNSINESP